MTRFDIVEGHYWYYYDNHGGQGTADYKRLSKIRSYFKPGRTSGPDSDNAAEVYANICNKRGASCPCRAGADKETL